MVGVFALRRTIPAVTLASKQLRLFALQSRNMSHKHTLVVVRHGESEWNLANRFTGWVDCDLTPKGKEEAESAGALLKTEGYEFDVCYTSVLQRAVKTLFRILEKTQQVYLPVHHSWRLNERHYGALQGLNKAETAEKHGEEQVLIWRRSYDIPPPALDENHEHYTGGDRRYKDVDPKDLPKTESLALCLDRVLPYWHETIAPSIKAGKNVLIAAHGNSLRALVKHLDGISEEEIVGLNIPTGVPLVYHLDENLKPIKHERAVAPLSGFYLGDAEAVKAAAEAVAKQGAKK